MKGVLLSAVCFFGRAKKVKYFIILKIPLFLKAGGTMAIVPYCTVSTKALQ